MAKSRERSEVELLRADNKRLTKQVKELQRTLGRLQKNSRNVEELEDLFKDMEYEAVEKSVPRTGGCPECGNALENVSLGVKQIIKCTKCAYSKIGKK